MMKSAIVTASAPAGDSSSKAKWCRTKTNPSV